MVKIKAEISCKYTQIKYIYLREKISQRKQKMKVNRFVFYTKVPISNKLKSFSTCQ